MSVFVSVDGFTLSCGFLIKELCIIYPNVEYNGDIPYSLLSIILEKVKDLKVYTCSDVAVKLPQQNLPTTAIRNNQDQGFKMPARLPDSKCF